MYPSLCDSPEKDMRMRVDAACACLYDDLLRKKRYVRLLPDGVNMALAAADSNALFMTPPPHSFGDGWVTDVLIAAYRDALLPLTMPINGPGIRNVLTTRSKDEFNEIVASTISEAAGWTQAEHRKGAYYSTLVRHVAQSCADNLLQCSPFESEHGVRLGHLADYTLVHSEALDWLGCHRQHVADWVRSRCMLRTGPDGPK